MNQIEEELSAPPRFSLATALLPGGISVFWIEGAENVLHNLLPINPLHINAPPSAPSPIRHGRLSDTTGVIVDEVLWTAPAPGRRILTGHGGPAVTQAVRDWLAERGCVEIPPSDPDAPAFFALADDSIEAEADRRLPLARTDTQAALLLVARRDLAARVDRELLPWNEREPQERAAAGVDSLRAWIAAGERSVGLLRERTLCLAGPVNAGKSTLLNRLAGRDRARVRAERKSDGAGTTLDAVEELLEMGGYAVRAVDLPGFSARPDELQNQALRRADARLRAADAVAFVLDGNAPLGTEARLATEAARGLACPYFLVRAKAELPPAWTDGEARTLFPAARAILSMSGENAVRFPKPCAGVTRDEAASTTDRATSGSAFPPSDAMACERDSTPAARRRDEEAEAFRRAAAACFGGGWDGLAWPFTEQQIARLRDTLAAWERGTGGFRFLPPTVDFHFRRPGRR